VVPVAATIATPDGVLAEPLPEEELLGALPDELLDDVLEDGLLEGLPVVALLVGAAEAGVGEPPPPLEQPDTISELASTASPIFPLRMIPA